MTRYMLLGLALSGCFLFPYTADGVTACTAYVNRTDAVGSPAAVVNWNLGAFQDRGPQCYEIRVGQSVMFAGGIAGSFGPDAHPLRNNGGDTPNPLGYEGPQEHFVATFADPGEFGYGCGTHASMKGSIKVVR